ncbi:MAG: cyclopropane-fatty-acyl-phospholipid synthase [Flavobacteriales bacterium]|jgi:cyclopropane-fatty-acyl-phospholipid synthase
MTIKKCYFKIVTLKQLLENSYLKIIKQEEVDVESPDIDLSNTRDKMSWSKRFVFKLLEQLSDTHIHLSDGGFDYHFGDSNADVRAKITVVDRKVYQRVLLGGSIGAAEAYVEGLWYADNMTNVVRIFSRNIEKLKSYEKRFDLLTRPFNVIKHRLSSNSKSGSRTNIAAHYDLSNDMYRMFLDPHMQYSSAVYQNANDTLEEAQEHKMKLICDYLVLTKEDHLLEVGTGWGGLACYAAKHYGCKVTTTTISPSQFAIAETRIKTQDLKDKVTLLLEDYRDLTGQYSKIVSVEMIEAVGHKFMPTYFKVLDKLLKPGGKLLLQSITINDHRYEDYRKSVDFIQRYIFPGGHLPSLSLICDQVKKHTTWYIDHLDDFRLDYAVTLKEWRHRFLSHKAEILSLGFNEEFIRLWEYYFCYCEGGFREELIGLAHIGLVKCKH